MTSTFQPILNVENEQNNNNPKRLIPPYQPRHQVKIMDPIANVPETIASCRRQLADGNTLEYRLQVLQQPERARACGAGPKSHADRRPVDPPPVVELRLFRGQGPDKQCYTDVTFSHNSNFILFATLELGRVVAVARGLPLPAAPVLTGQSTSGMAYLDRPIPAGYFIFPDLSVRHEGKYRLRFSLFEEPKDEPLAISGDPLAPREFCSHRLDVKSRPFTVFSAKKFPGLAESTGLSRVVAEQGCRVRIRRDARVRIRPDLRKHRERTEAREIEPAMDETARLRAERNAGPPKDQYEIEKDILERHQQAYNQPPQQPQPQQPVYQQPTPPLQPVNGHSRSESDASTRNINERYVTPSQTQTAYGPPPLAAPVPQPTHVHQPPLGPPQQRAASNQHLDFGPQQQQFQRPHQQQQPQQWQQPQPHPSQQYQPQQQSHSRQSSYEYSTSRQGSDAYQQQQQYAQHQPQIVQKQYVHQQQQQQQQYGRPLTPSYQPQPQIQYAQTPQPAYTTPYQPPPQQQQQHYQPQLYSEPPQQQQHYTPTPPPLQQYVAPTPAAAPAPPPRQRTPAPSSHTKPTAPSLPPMRLPPLPSPAQFPSYFPTPTATPPTPPVAAPAPTVKKRTWGRVFNTAHTEGALVLGQRPGEQERTGGNSIYGGSVYGGGGVKSTEGGGVSAALYGAETNNLIPDSDSDSDDEWRATIGAKLKMTYRRADGVEIVRRLPHEE